MEITPEQAIIAVMISRTGAAADIFPRLKPEYFQNESAKRAYAVLEILNKKSLPVDIVLFAKEGIATALISNLDVSSVMGWVSSLSNHTPTEHYLAAVIDDYVQRQIPDILSAEAFVSGVFGDGSAKATRIKKKIDDLLDLNYEFEKAIDMHELMNRERAAFYKRKQIAESGSTTGINTGITPVNKFTGGWQPELIVIAGRPGMGKTAVALFHGVKAGVPGIYFNLEMRDTQLAQRLVLMHQNMPSNKLRDGTLDDMDILKFEKAVGSIENLPLKVYSKPGCGVYEAIRVMRQYHKAGKCKFAIIDYLQLLTIETSSRGISREQEVSNMIKELKKAQLEMDIPIILLSQLSREVEKRGGVKKPILSDLRESGEIEQSADTVVFAYRPAMYGLNTDSGQPYTNEMFFLVEKHRQGSVGTIEFRHNNTMTSFYGASESPNFDQVQIPNKKMPVSSSFYEKQDPDMNPFT